MFANLRAWIAMPALVGLVLCLVAGCNPGTGNSTSDAAPPVAGPGDPDAPVPPVDSPEMEDVPARVGVGKQGQIIRDRKNILTTPVSVLFDTRQRVVFEFQIPQAMQLYKAEHGHFPKSQEEFMENIVQFNSIRLPELPAGHEYVYDPDKGQLMVRKPVE